MARRGRNEGTIRQRKDGRWEARLVMTDVDGRRVRRSFLGRTRADVRDKLQDATRAESTGIAVPSTRLTVAPFLAQWLADVAKPSVRPSTFVIYESICRLHLVPGLGHVSLARLTPQQVQAFLNAKQVGGSHSRGRRAGSGRTMGSVGSGASPARGLAARSARSASTSSGRRG